MKKMCLVWGLVFIGFPYVLFGQYVPQPTATLPQNEPIQKLVDRVSPYGWLYFRESLSVPDTQFFSIYGQFFGLGQDDDMRLYQRDTDQQGRTIARFRQYYKGIEVEGGEYALHSESNLLKIGHGKIIEQLDLNTQPETEELYALRRALDDLKVKTYAWQDPSWEESIQEELADSSARYFPKGELRLMLLSGDQLIQSRYRLVWHFNIRTLDPDDFLSVYIDTKTSKILKVSSLRRTCSQQSGTAKTLYNNYQSLDMTKRAWPRNDYVLNDCRKIETKFHERNSFGETRGWKWVDKITHTDNDWDETHIQATSAHWAAQKAWDYFYETFDLEGPDGEGKGTRIWVDWSDANGEEIGDAMFEPSSKSNYLYVGSKNQRSLATLDIIGHEYSHGVVAGSAGLVYERESGALDESFADIFGVLIEAYTQEESSPSDWLIGEDVEAVRSIANPSAYDQPMFYGEEDPFWFDASTQGCETPSMDLPPLGNDFCGVHTNGGVQNYWFYLLSNGGLVRDQQVYGIGLDKAAQVVYFNLKRYMQAYSNYQDARLGSIQAATDLFGECSNEVAQVKNAWAAVGVGEPNQQLCLEIEGPPYICKEELHLWYTYKVNAVEGTLIEWQNLPDTWLYEISGYDGGTLTFKGIFDPGESYDLQLVGHNDEAYQQQSLRIRFGAECKAEEDTIWKTNPDSLTDWAFVPVEGGERMSVTLPEGMIPATVGLYDIQGRRQQQLFVQERYFSLELEGVADGMYFLRIEGNKGLIHKIFRLIR